MGGGSSQQSNITPMLQMPGAQQFNPFAPPQQQQPTQIQTTAMNPIYQGGIQQPNNSQNQILQQLLSQFTGEF